VTRRNHDQVAALQERVRRAADLTLHVRVGFRITVWLSLALIGPLALDSRVEVGWAWLGLVPLGLLLSTLPVGLTVAFRFYLQRALLRQLQGVPSDLRAEGLSSLRADPSWETRRLARELGRERRRPTELSPAPTPVDTSNYKKFGAGGRAQS
jgi:hypothetical protein